MGSGPGLSALVARRAFMTGLAAALVADVRAAGAQAPGKVWRGTVLLYPGLDNSIFQGNLNGVREALAAAGYVPWRGPAAISPGCSSIFPSSRGSGSKS